MQCVIFYNNLSFFVNTDSEHCSHDTGLRTSTQTFFTLSTTLSTAGSTSSKVGQCGVLSLVSVGFSQDGLRGNAFVQKGGGGGGLW